MEHKNPLLIAAKESYYFARFNKKIEIPQYDEEEYTLFIDGKLD